MPVLHPLWRGAETALVQVVVSQWMPEVEQDGTENDYLGAALFQVSPGIALLIAQVGKATGVVCQQNNIPLLADSASAFEAVQLFADLVTEAVAHVAAIAVVVAVFAVVFVSVVTFVSTAVESDLNAVLAAVSVSAATE